MASPARQETARLKAAQRAQALNLPPGAVRKGGRRANINNATTSAGDGDGNFKKAVLSKRQRKAQKRAERRKQQDLSGRNGNCCDGGSKCSTVKLDAALLFGGVRHNINGGKNGGEKQRSLEGGVGGAETKGLQYTDEADFPSLSMEPSGRD